jgi:hypothetical protein
MRARGGEHHRRGVFRISRDIFEREDRTERVPQQGDALDAELLAQPLNILDQDGERVVR